MWCSFWIEGRDGVMMCKLAIYMMVSEVSVQKYIITSSHNTVMEYYLQRTNGLLLSLSLD